MSLVFLLPALLLAGPASAQSSTVVVGANVNMVSGASFPNGDPFQRQQNEPSVAFSSRNNLNLLAGANDYRAVDVPGLPGGRETGDSWLSYFWSTNGGATWKSTLIPGYPQDPACQGANPPTLCGYAAGADPVVRAGVNGMFYYSGIVFERSDPSRSAIFVSRFIDLNNDEGGEPIRFLDTVILDSNDDGLVFLDKSWIGVDIPRTVPAATKALSVEQRDGSSVAQTVQCGNLYVGYAAIGGEGQDLRSEIRLATSSDCGDTWAIQLISEPDSLNQGANIGIAPATGDVHVVWRRFDTVETFLGIPAAGCPADPASWEVSAVWPVSTITVAGVTYTMEQAQELLATKHKGDESIKVVNEVIAAKLNLLTGGGDPVPGFNPNIWGQQLSNYIAAAEAWLLDNPVGSDPKHPEKQVGMDIKKDIQEILLGSGTCGGGGGTAGGSTGQTNAIMLASSDDGGQTFGAPVEIDESSTFDQGSTTFSFRTTAYPTATVDAAGRIYAAWAARGFAADLDPTAGDARIVVSTSSDGVNWTAPYAVDEPDRPGHQIKPSLLFAGGQLTLVYYDFRQDVSNIFESFVVDLPEPDRLRHTVDVRVATALPAAAPVFADYSLISPSTEPTDPSVQASRYKFLTSGFDEFGGANDVTIQAEYMPPNYPMFADGTTPFIGDYVDIAAPNLIFEEGMGWRFATDPGDVQIWQAVWSDNRDVIPPPDGDWSKYVAPITQAQVSLFDPTVILPSCNDVVFTDAPLQWQAGSLYTGTRNQNVYSASITQGLVVAAPGNNRPLVNGSQAPLERAFVVYVQNATDQERTYQLTVLSAVDVEASFVQGQSVSSIQVVIPPYSSAAETVYALSASGSPSSETIQVDVSEIGGTLTGSVLLNSDPTAPDPLSFSGPSLLDAEVHNPAILNPAILNPAILNPSADPSLCTNDPTLCVQNPAILNPAILNPAIFNPAILNPAILNPAIFNPAIFNPAILNPAILNPAIFNPAIFNPAILNPAILNPAILNPAILNPAILNPAILNPAILNPAILNPAILNPAILNPAILNTTTADSGQVDVTFAIRNDGNATTAYDLNLAAQQLAGLDYELLVYSLNETPITDGCTLTTEAQQQLVFRQDDPLNTPLDGTFYLEPGEEVLVTFRVTPDVDSPTPADPVTDFDVADLSGQVTSQPTNTNGTPQPPDDQFGSLGVCAAAPTNLTNWWPGNGNASDIVGTNDGTLFGGATFGSGLVDQGFLFDGTDDYMDIGRPLSEAAGTVDFWVRRNGFLSAGSDVFFGAVGPNLRFSPTFFVRSGGTLLWEFGNLAVQNTSVPLTIGQWYHVAMTWQPAGANTQVEIYIDGALVDTGVAVTVTDFQADLYVGGYNQNYYNPVATAEQFSNSSIDELDIFDRALSGAEIQAIHAAGAEGKCVPPVTAPVLVSLWRADGDALDSVGGNDGTLQNGAGFGAGRSGQAFSLSSASAQHVLVADDPSLRITGELTMAAWIFPTGPGSNPSEGGIIVNKEWAYEVARFTDGTIRWATGNGVNNFAPLNSWVNSGVTAPLNTWTHVAVTYDQGVGTTYVNGSQVHSFVVGVDNLGAGTQPLRIGGRGILSAYFDGRIDEVGIYDSVLTAADVLALYNAAPQSTFDADSDGWTVANDVGGWVSSGGNSGGYLQGTDSGGATGSTAFYFSAPAKFKGDKSALYGGELRYDLQQSDLTPTILSQPWVVLVGAGLTLVYDASVSDGPPGTSWTPYIVPLDASDPRWHVAVNDCWTSNITLPSACNFTGPTPTLGQFLSVLGSLDTLLIRGEYSTTLDTGGLDNAQLVAGVAAPLVVSFDRPFVAPISTEYVDQGVLFGSSNCSTCSAYVCNECSPVSSSGPDYLAVNSAGPEAVLTAEFRHPLSAARVTATDVSVYVNDTEASVRVQTFDINGVLIEECANVFAGCSAATVTGNRAILDFVGPIAELRFIDSGGDGHVLDDLVYTIDP